MVWMKIDLPTEKNLAQRKFMSGPETSVNIIIDRNFEIDFAKPGE